VAAKIFTLQNDPEMANLPIKLKHLALSNIQPIDLIIN
jgi:hypothetical protein